MPNYDINKLGQCIDTSLRPSLGACETNSVKMTLSGDNLNVVFMTVVNLLDTTLLAQTKAKLSVEADSFVEARLKQVKGDYKESAEKILKLKQLSNSDDIEFVSMNIHSPRKTIYYRKRYVYEIG